MEKVNSYSVLSDNEIDVILFEKVEEYVLNDYTSCYKFNIVLHDSSKQIGEISVCITNSKDDVKYICNIDCNILDEFDKDKYTIKSYKLIKDFACKNGIYDLIITCCEKLNCDIVSTLLDAKLDSIVPNSDVCHNCGLSECDKYIYKLSF